MAPRPAGGLLPGHLGGPAGLSFLPGLTPSNTAAPAPAAPAAPPPKPPRHATASVGGKVLQQGWPEAVGSAKQIAVLEAVEGNVRNDVVVPRSMLGRLIGAQGGRRHPRATREG